MDKVIAATLLLLLPFLTLAAPAWCPPQYDITWYRGPYGCCLLLDTHT